MRTYLCWTKVTNFSLGGKKIPSSEMLKIMNFPYLNLFILNCCFCLPKLPKFLHKTLGGTPYFIPISRTAFFRRMLSMKIETNINRR